MSSLCFVQDESILIWISGKEEKHLKLSHVSRIIPGQRTVSSHMGAWKKSTDLHEDL